MRITPKNTVKKFLTGGTVDPNATLDPNAQTTAPVDETSQEDPIAVLALMSAQALQNQDCNMAMQVCQAFMQIVQQMGTSGLTEPTFYRKGGQIIRRTK